MLYPLVGEFDIGENLINSPLIPGFTIDGTPLFRSLRASASLQHLNHKGIAVASHKC